jgi:hypothetical protein
MKTRACKNNGVEHGGVNIGGDGRGARLHRRGQGGSSESKRRKTKKDKKYGGWDEEDDAEDEIRNGTHTQT